MSRDQSNIDMSMASLNDSTADLHQVQEANEELNQQSSHASDQSSEKQLSQMPTMDIKQKYQNNVEQFNEDEENEYGEEDDVKRRSIKGDRSEEVQQHFDESKEEEDE